MQTQQTPEAGQSESGRLRPARTQTWMRLTLFPPALERAPYGWAICLKMRTITTTHINNATAADTQSIPSAYARPGTFDRSSAARSKGSARCPAASESVRRYPLNAARAPTAGRRKAPLPTTRYRRAVREVYAKLGRLALTCDHTNRVVREAK
jgi:hypothetical protein